MQALCPLDPSTPWRMGSPFQGLEYAPGENLRLSFPKREEGESRIEMQLEGKFLGAIDRPATAPSPVPLLEDMSHPTFSESLLVSDPAGCHPALQSQLVCLFVTGLRKPSRLNISLNTLSHTND